MSTRTVDAAELAPTARYFADPAVADLLAEGATANRAACLAYGWSEADIDSNLGGSPVTAVAILAAAPVKRPTRIEACKGISALIYNCDDCLPADVADGLESLYLRIMEGVTWGRYGVPMTPEGLPDPLLSDCLRYADSIRKARTAA